MLEKLNENWSKPYSISRVLRAAGMDVPQRLRRERFVALIDQLRSQRVEVQRLDGLPNDAPQSPGVDGTVRLRRLGGASAAASAEPAHRGAGRDASSSPGPAAARTPTNILGYPVVRVIAGGGMSRCYVVRDADGNQRFLKVVGVGTSDSAAFQRERSIYDKLDRAQANHVVQVHDVRHSEHELGLVLELADGTLKEYREARGHLGPDEVKRIARDVLSGLQELHSLDIVHRDLKPENVLRFGNVWKLADFGISKNRARLMTQGVTMKQRGTPGYTAPEQWEGREAVASADIYSFGKLLVYLLTGQTDADHVLAHARDWIRVVRGCLQYDPRQRLSAAQVEAELL